METLKVYILRGDAAASDETANRDKTKTVDARVDNDGSPTS